MFSTEKNIEQIALLIEKFKDYIKLETDYLKFDVVEKTVRLLTALFICITTFFLAIIALIFFSFAASAYLEIIVGKGTSLLIIAGFFILLLVLCIIFRRQLFEKPILKLLCNIFMK